MKPKFGGTKDIQDSWHCLFQMVLKMEAERQIRNEQLNLKFRISWCKWETVWALLRLHFKEINAFWFDECLIGIHYISIPTLAVDEIL